MKDRDTEPGTPMPVAVETPEVSGATAFAGGAAAGDGQRVLVVAEREGPFTALSLVVAQLEECPVVLTHASDEVLAIEALAASDYECIIFCTPRDRQSWLRFVRDRRVPSIPVIFLEEVPPSSRIGRTRRREQLLLEGAAAYLRLAELSGPLVEATIVHALERARMRRAMEEVQERFALAVRGSNDGVWEWIIASDDMHFSRRWRELLGYGVDDLANAAEEWFSRVHPEDLPGLKSDLHAHLDGAKPYHEHEHRLRASDGTYRWVITRGVAQRDEKGQPVRMAGSLADTSDFRLREQKLLEESRNDALTNLPRREPFLERLRNSIDLSSEYDDYAFSVLVVDVDRFRWLADSIGHHAADKMLAVLAQRLASCIRPGDTLSRYEGDMFSILLDNVDDLELGSQIAERIRATTNEPFDIDGQTVYATVSIGLTTSRRGYDDAEEVMNDAMAAANRAKERGQDHYAVFETKMRIDALTTLRLEVALRQAVEREEFELHYQPIVDLESARLVGFEALVRWRHPRRGLVPPSEFIPLAEQTGLIVPLGRWVIREAVAQLVRWRGLFPTTELTMAVNLSGRQVADPRLLEEIQKTVGDNALLPGTLKLELTESVLVENADVVQRFLTTLRGSGVSIWVDDFGTGYSSLSYLHRFPVDGLKIDKAFVDGLDGSEQSAAMIRTILSLADNLGVSVVAEGIEEPVQAKQLRELGCKEGQGFLFSKPIVADAVKGLLDPN
ncbi:MAG: EAL domain-containing protein [Myxococcota bacterium]